MPALVSAPSRREVLSRLGGGFGGLVLSQLLGAGQAPAAAVTDRCGTADLHATMLHLLGLDHARVAYKHHGRDERLTDVYQPRLLEPLLR